jgi:CDP-diacylglycerol--glycerol-3-phosphate 3-phosphatidyltransferase
MKFMSSIPNLITLSRIVLIFPIISFVLTGNYKVAFLIFLFGCFTDFLDGYVSRAMNQESLLGESLDLLADKLYVCSILIFLSFHLDNFFFLIMTILIIAREISVSSLRQYLLSAQIKKRTKVNLFGKLKTFFQMFSIGATLILMNTKYDTVIEILIFLAALISWASLINYSYEKK